MDNDQVAVGQDDEQAQNAVTADDAAAEDAAAVEATGSDENGTAQTPTPAGEPDVAQAEGHTEPQDAAEEPAAEKPVAEEPVAEEAATEAPAEEPAAEEQPAADEPAAEEPVAAEQAEEVAAEAPTEEPVAEESVAQEPAAAEPVAAEPAAAEPAAEEPAAEEAAAEEQTPEAPTAEEQPAQVAAAEPETPEPEDEGPGIEDLKTGSTMRGKVRNIVDFGAFIDIGVGRDGLAHVSTLKRAGIDKTLKVGDEIDVVVRRVDTDNNRISLTVPRAEREVKASLSSIEVGSVVTGKVMRLVDFGAFIDIGAPTDGLVHISQLGGGFVNHPSEVLNVGDEVQLRVLDVDIERRRISLTMKDLAGEQEGPAAEAPGRQGGPREGSGRQRRPRGQGRGRSPEPETYSTPEEPGFPTAVELAFQQALAEKKRKQRRSRA